MTDDVPTGILKVENQTGQFWRTSASDWVSIDQIDKDGLMDLVELALTGEVQIERFDEEKLANPAQRIIYKSISEKLQGLNLQRNKFRDERDRTYLEAIRKYTVDESKQ